MEPESITGAEYVQPSADSVLKPGQRVSSLFRRGVLDEYTLQRVTSRVYFVSRHFYCSLFYVGTRGVVLIDPVLGSADSLLRAIASVTPLPVTAVVYSHFHSNHIGGSRRLLELLPAPPLIIASDHTELWMRRFGSDLPRPACVLRWPDDGVEVEGTQVRLRGLPCPGHSPDHSVWLLPAERVGHSADLINIDQLPFGGFAGQDPLALFKPNLEFARDLDWDWFSGGHGNIGEKSDFEFYLSYLAELESLIAEEIPRPAEVPDLSLTDYLDGLPLEAKERLLTELDNHFSLYLYGRAIARGEEPVRPAGPGAFMGGLVGEWAESRRKAAEEAVPRILERLRPKYGRMYSFDDAQPINIRLLAMSMQPTLENRLPGAGGTCQSSTDTCWRPSDHGLFRSVALWHVAIFCRWPSGMLQRVGGSRLRVWERLLYVRVKEPFEKVVAEHGGTVLRVCRVLLGAHDAEDAWSETFLAALRAYPELPADANVEAWLVTIAHRKAIDVTRAAARRPLPVEELPEEPTELGIPGADDDSAELWQAVRALPGKQRQAVAYHYVAGLPYAEIAQIIGGSVDAARRAAADGVKNLRKGEPS